MCLFLTGEVSYLLVFFLILQVMQPDLYPVIIHWLRPLKPWRKPSSLWLRIQHGWGLGACHSFQGIIISLLLMSIIAAFWVLAASAGSCGTGISFGFTFVCPDPLKRFDRQLDQKAFLAFSSWKGAWFDQVVSQIKNRRNYGSTSHPLGSSGQRGRESFLIARLIS